MNKRKTVGSQAVDLSVQIVTDTKTGKQRGYAKCQHDRKDAQRYQIAADLKVDLPQCDHVQRMKAKRSCRFGVFIEKGADTRKKQQI